MKPPKARICFVFAQGAGAGMTHPFMEQVAIALYERGIATLRYQFSVHGKGQQAARPAGNRARRRPRRGGGSAQLTTSAGGLRC
jgi:predicted alpha/beta-hydrolase family hydrolase